MKKRLFQYAVLIHNYNDKQEFVDTQIIIPVDTILARDEKEVVFKVTRLIPEEYAANPDNVEILVRNF